MRLSMPAFVMPVLAMLLEGSSVYGIDPLKRPTSLTSKDCVSLVNALAHPSPRPRLTGVDKELGYGSDVVYPDGYDKTAAKKIAASYTKLGASMDAALPVVMKYIDDTRYSYTWETDSGMYFIDRCVVNCTQPIASTSIAGGTSSGRAVAVTKQKRRKNGSRFGRVAVGATFTAAS